MSVLLTLLSLCPLSFGNLYAQSAISASTVSISSSQALSKEEKPSPAPESLSVLEPPGLAGQFPSVKRFKAPLKWKADGWVLEKSSSKVKETDEFQLMSPPGSFADVRLRKGIHISAGDQLTVYRLASRHEKDLDAHARYLFKIGRAVVVKILTHSRCRIQIESANDAVQDGDLVKKDW